MGAEIREGLYSILQFVALALPAITIYLQVLTSIFQAEKNAEIQGTVPKAFKNTAGQRQRAPEDDPNVVEAIPVLVTEAHSRFDFVFALGSLVILLLAAFTLVARLLVSWSVLMSVGTSLVVIGLVLFGVALLMTARHSITLVFQS